VSSALTSSYLRPRLEESAVAQGMKGQRDLHH
jgi:hypothetical protein